MSNVPSHRWRWGLAVALVVCVGLAGVAVLRAPALGHPAAPGPMAAPPLKKGLAGFDFTRIGPSGAALARQDGAWHTAGRETDGTQWDCLRDNVSGLWWEAKTRDETGGVKHLRHMDHTYSASGTSTPFGARCAGLPGACNAQAYVDAVNAAGLCGFHDWRLPTVTELKPLTSINKGGATIDVAQFPNTAPAGYWTASPYPHRSDYVWYVYFAGAGDAFGDAPTANHAVRLVRSGS